MKKTIIKILFKLLKTPIAIKYIDQVRKKEWLGLQYPLQSFHDYISTRNLHLLQILGEGISHNEEYWINVGRRIELGYLLTEAKREFEIAEKNRIKKQNENAKQ